MQNSLSLIQDFHPKRWTSNFENNSTSYLFKMGFIYHGLGLALASSLWTIQEYGFGYVITPPDFSLGLLLLAGPFEETLFFGIPFYLTNNHYVLLGTGLVWAFIHIFNTDIVNPSLEFLSYPNLAFALVSLFYSLRTWISGKGWFSILFHSLWNLIVFVVVLIEGQYDWSLISEDPFVEVGMLIISVPLLAITYGLYRWRTERTTKMKRRSKLIIFVVSLGVITLFGISIT